MEEGGESGAGSKHATPHGNPNPAPASAPPPPPPSADAAAAPPPASRTPFTSLSQVDADHALARVLQDQERAYARLSSNGFYYASSDDGSYDYEEEDEESEWDEQGYADREDGGSVEGSDHEENASDANEPNTDRAEFENDEAFASALQGVEERLAPVQFMHLTGLQIWSQDGDEDRGSSSQDAWQEIEADEFLYEELIALGEVVGTESRGLPTDTIATLPTVNYKAENVHDENVEQCVICRLEYEDGDSLVLLSCKHKYHSECINEWLQINKVCPVCNAEVSTSGGKKD